MFTRNPAEDEGYLRDVKIGGAPALPWPRVWTRV
jgi:hypothetical protein